jgi:hypothetical protein
MYHSPSVIVLSCSFTRRSPGSQHATRRYIWAATAAARAMRDLKVTRAFDHVQYIHVRSTALRLRPIGLSSEALPYLRRRQKINLGGAESNARRWARAAPGLRDCLVYGHPDSPFLLGQPFRSPSSE